MISNTDITEALLRNDKVVTCQFLGKGIFLLRMEGDTLPMKTNSYGIMKIVDPERFNREFSPRNFVVGMDELDRVAREELDELDEHDMQCAKAEQEHWEELESDDGHRELYTDTVLE
jgi:hypothetical protein